MQSLTRFPKLTLINVERNISTEFLRAQKKTFKRSKNHLACFRGSSKHLNSLKKKLLRGSTRIMLKTNILKI